MHSVLVTGGTGFFAHAFVSRLLAMDTHRVCIFSRCEHRQAEMAAEIGEDDRVRFFVGDVRDRDRLRRAMDRCDVVVHAAALKRIEVGHYNPDEMVKTNILGAMNVIEAARDAGVDRTVFLSSDKAFEPVSPYGQSKAIAEALFLAANRSSPGRFAVTRYGNVAGSTGSVIPKWRGLIAEGKPIAVTDPDCTRFWMTSDEAVDLVLKTIDAMPGEVAIPELPAFRLGDLVEAMGSPDLHLLGLEPWEKKHESMGPGNSSDIAPRLTVSELEERLAHVRA